LASGPCFLVMKNMQQLQCLCRAGSAIQA